MPLRRSLLTLLRDSRATHVGRLVRRVSWACLVASVWVGVARAEDAPAEVVEAPATPAEVVPATEVADVDAASSDTAAGVEAPVELGARARRAAPIAARNGLDPTAAGTAILLEGRPQSGETLREVLAEAPGARVLSTGALGQFNTITLRGTELGQTTVMLDDLPLGGPDVGPVDLSLLPIAAFGSIEVYRGGAPAWISDGSIGGVLRLMPRAADVSYVRPHADYGAFRTARAMVDAGIVDGRLRLASSFGVVSSRQDFPFRNENGTLYDASDDFDDRQRNARFTQRHAFVSGRVRLGRGELHLVYLGVGREGGYPGAGIRRTLYASQSVAQNTAALAWSSEHRLDDVRRGRVQARIGINTQRMRFRDLYGGVGLGITDSDDRSRVISTRLASSLDLMSWLEATAVLNARVDWIDRTDHAAADDQAPAHRFSAGGTLETRLHGRIGRVRAELRPSYQIQRTTLRAEYDGNYGAIEHVNASRWLRTGRVGVALSPIAALTIQGSFHSGVRAPSILELFGNRSTVVGNPELLSESGLGGDLGVVGRTSGERYCLVGEIRGFHQTMDDVIVLIPTSQYQARAKNLPRATSLGLEASGRLTLGQVFDLVVQWNATRTRDAAGYQLTNRPASSGYVRATVGTGPRSEALSDARLYADLTYVSVTYLAPNELKTSPARTFLGLGAEVSLFAGSLLASFSVRDVTNVGGTDFLGYPLSGRSWSGSLAYRKEFE